MLDHAPFLATIRAQPEDDGPRLVYADWLEERGDPRAEFIRLQHLPTPTEEQQERTTVLLTEHGRSWAATDLGVSETIFQQNYGVTLEFHKGFSFWPLTVDYGKSLEEMIAAGKYDYANADITAEHFPINGTGMVEEEVVLVRFDRSIGSAGVIRAMELMGLEPAPSEDLLALGAKHPDLQRKFPLAGLGSVWVDSHRLRGVLYAYGHSDKRNLRLRWDDRGWNGRCRFPAVCK